MNIKKGFLFLEDYLRNFYPERRKIKNYLFFINSDSYINQVIFAFKLVIVDVKIFKNSAFMRIKVWEDILSFLIILADENCSFRPILFHNKISFSKFINFSQFMFRAHRSRTAHPNRANLMKIMVKTTLKPNSTKYREFFTKVRTRWI